MLVAAHFNHRLRGEESDADEAFVTQLCGAIGVPCEIGRAELGGSDSRPGLSEDDARRQRYRFLQATAERLGLRYVATAHTADDQAETILHRMLRGTGLAGLSGMARARRLGSAVSLVRPLLSFRRSDVLAYLAAKGQPYRVDSSNASPAYTRNRIRHDLLPRLAQIHPEAIEAVCRLGRLAGEAQGVFDAIVRQLAVQCVERRSDSEVVILLGPLADQPPYLIRELLSTVWRSQGWPRQAMGMAEWESLAAMARPAAEATQLAAEAARPVKRDLPGGIHAEVRGERLWLRA